MTQIVEMQVTEIEIPKEMLRKRFDRRRMYAYALSKRTIGIGSLRVKEWEDAALWSGEVVVRNLPDSVVVKLPSELSSFYDIRSDNHTISVSEKGDNIQIDVG